MGQQLLKYSHTRWQFTLFVQTFSFVSNYLIKVSIPKRFFFVVKKSHKICILQQLKNQFKQIYIKTATYRPAVGRKKNRWPDRVRIFLVGIKDMILYDAQMCNKLKWYEKSHGKMKNVSQLISHWYKLTGTNNRRKQRRRPKQMVIFALETSTSKRDQSQDPTMRFR